MITLGLLGMTYGRKKMRFLRPSYKITIFPTSPIKCFSYGMGTIGSRHGMRIKVKNFKMYGSQPLEWWDGRISQDQMAQCKS
jgi:hypothetical protein